MSSGYPGLQSYTVKVVATDYNHFAMVFFKKTSGKKQYFKITLYGEFLPDLQATLRVGLSRPWLVPAPSSSHLSVDFQWKTSLRPHLLVH